jgi:ATP-dependent helicase/DNAse subunit B
MPTFDQQDGLYAYNFYRLLQRADNITIVYDTTVGKMSEGEPSRFLKQIEYELAQANPNLKFHQKTAHIPPQFTNPNEITIEKDAQTMQVLERYTGQGDRYLSPSTLATYITCPLQFYFTKILGLEVSEELEENVDARKLGDIFHETMEDLYKDKMGKKLQKRDFIELRTHLESKLIEKYKEHYRKDMDKPAGKNVLNYHFLKTSAEKIFAIEEKEENLSVTEIETERYKTAVPIRQNGITRQISLNGKIDRLDDHNGTPRIVDYKTGSKVELSPKSIANPEMLFDNAEKKANLQGLIYALL